MAQDDLERGEVTFSDIEKMLEERIRSGYYPVGARLPTVRELAQELGVNKYVTDRAYQALKFRGYLELVRGRGAFVRQPEPISAALNSSWLAKLDQLLEEAKQQALHRELIMHGFNTSLDRVFGRQGSDLRIAFVECNTADIGAIGGEISSAVRHQLQGVLLADLMNNPEEVGLRFDLVVTTFYHLGEVSRALGQEAKQKVIGVHAMPTHETLLKIARLQALVVGLVCDRSDTIDNLVHIIQTYHPTATILPALIEDESRLQTLLTKADAIVVTRSCHERLPQSAPQVPVITVVFTVDQQSIDFLRGRIREHADALANQHAERRAALPEGQ